MVENSLRNRMRNSKNRVKRISVDMSNRLQRSIGTPVLQSVEIHYHGKPMTFDYVGPIEVLNVDVVKNEFQSGGNDKEEIPVKFDPTRKRKDISNVNFECSCGNMIEKVVIPTALTNDVDETIKYAVKIDKTFREHYNNQHVLKLTNIETLVEIIPENERIKNFSNERINYYRIFPKKTAEIRYLASYGQDLLAEAPQYKFTDSVQGGKDIGRQNVLFMLFIFALIEIFTYISQSSQSNYYSPVSQPNLTPWYVLIAMMIGMVMFVWRLHIHDLSKTMIKIIDLESGPYYISNRGVLPVIMRNSELTPMLDFVSKALQIDSKHVKDVYYSLQNWSDAEVVLSTRGKTIAQVELELSGVHTELSDIVKIEHQFRKDADLQSEWYKYLIYGIISTAITYTLVLYVIGVF